MDSDKVAFNRPYMTGKELYYIAEAHFNGKLAGDGDFTKRCHKWLEERIGCTKALLTHSCTAALEMGALLMDLKPGDEVIMPSFTFVSTANAFVLRGAVPVFVDIRPDTLNIDEHLIEEAITEKTKAIAPVHYAGVSCEMDVIMDIARSYSLYTLEDAAQGMQASYKGKALGSIGDFGALSFHETKNIISGEGGALLVNNEQFSQRAEIIREKGTDRSRFFRGEVDKYTWQEAGSSFLPGEIVAAFLWAQLEEAKAITEQRMGSWAYYHELLKLTAEQGQLQLPTIPAYCQHNAHLYYVLLEPDVDRQRVLSAMKEDGVSPVFHYVPLHTSPAGQRYGRCAGELENTVSLSERLIRLPLWAGITLEQQERVVSALLRAMKS